MWLISGAFDGQSRGELNFRKTKLLKTGTTYTLGRKDAKLVINHAKISKEHCELTVKGQAPDDVYDSSLTPVLEIFNKRDKPLSLSRNNQERYINPSATEELQDGDKVTIANGVVLELKWERVCCYTPLIRGKSPISTEKCASLGVNIVHTLDSRVTHHLTASYTATAATAASLLSACQLVKPDWLSEVLRLGDLPENGSPTLSSLEQTFVLPSPTKFRPSFSPSLSSDHKVFKVWEPNEERLNLLQGYRFLFVGEKGREADIESRELVSRGGGSWEGFYVGAGRSKFHQALVKGSDKVKTSEGKSLVLIGDDLAMKASIGGESLQELVDEARSFGLRFLNFEQVIQSVIDVNTSNLNSSATELDEGIRIASLPASDRITDPHRDELVKASPESGPPRRLRRLVSRQVSQEAVLVEKAADTAVVPEEDEEPRPTRKILTRRARSVKPAIIGIDDPSSILDNPPDASAIMPPLSGLEPASVYIDPLTAPLPVRPSRLKRRAGTVLGTSESILGTQFPASMDLAETNVEPPLKKFKALFEASDPDNIGFSSITGTITGDNIDGMSESAFPGTESLPNIHPSSQSFPHSQSLTQTQTQTPLDGERQTNGQLPVVREEEEETPTSGRGSGVLGKRKPSTDADDDIEMAGVEAELQGIPGVRSAPALKRRAVENIDSVTPQGERAGAVVGSSSKPASTSKPQSTSKTSTVHHTSKAKADKGGAAPGQLDTDAAFLKAIASTKRGKKGEDSFDREFNKLKISKPDLEREEPEKDWAVLEDFGDETNLRGNFMVVVPLDVHRKEGERSKEVRVEWQTRPNFKKFKKKNSAASSKRIELVTSNENEYGTGESQFVSRPRKRAPSRSRSESLFGSPLKQTQDQAKARFGQGSRKGKERALIDDDSVDEEFGPISTRRSKSVATSRAQSPVVASSRSRAQSRAATQARAKEQPLFIVSEDDEDPLEALEENNTFDNFDFNDESREQSLTLKSSAGSQEPMTEPRKSARSTTKVKKPLLVIVEDDDSDDGATFKGFQAKKRGR